VTADTASAGPADEHAIERRSLTAASSFSWPCRY